MENSIHGGDVLKKLIYRGPVLLNYNANKLHNSITTLGGALVLMSKDTCHDAYVYHLWESTVLVRTTKDGLKSKLEVCLFYDKYDDNAGDIEKLLKPSREKLVDEEDSYIVF